MFTNRDYDSIRYQETCPPLAVPHPYPMARPDCALLYQREEKFQCASDEKKLKHIHIYNNMEYGDTKLTCDMCCDRVRAKYTFCIFPTVLLTTITRAAVLLVCLSCGYDLTKSQMNGCTTIVCSRIDTTSDIRRKKEDEIVKALATNKTYTDDSRFVYYSVQYGLRFNWSYTYYSDMRALLTQMTNDDTNQRSYGCKNFAEYYNVGKHRFVCPCCSCEEDDLVNFCEHHFICLTSVPDQRRQCLCKKDANEIKTANVYSIYEGQLWDNV